MEAGTRTVFILLPARLFTWRVEGEAENGGKMEGDLP